MSLSSERAVHYEEIRNVRIAQQCILSVHITYCLSLLDDELLEEVGLCLVVPMLRQISYPHSFSDT